MIDEESNLDFSALTFEQFERFFFDRRVIREKEGIDFFDAYCPGMSSFASSSPTKTVELLEQLMTDFRRIGERYTLPQINQGVWALFGPRIEIQEHLWMETVSIALRQRCIHAMVVPYRDFVCGHPADEMENCFDMWWDMIAHAFWSQVDYLGHKVTGVDDTVLTAMFETLCEILSLPDSRCQQYALHGLGHVRHPGVFAVVQKFIDAHREEIPPQTLRWMEGCRDGKVM